MAHRGFGEGEGMYAIRVDLCMGNILTDFTPLSIRGEGRKRRALRAAEPRRTHFRHFANLIIKAQNNHFKNVCVCGAVRIPCFAITKKCTPLRGFAFFCYGGGEGIRTPVGLHPNGFQDRLVMTTSIRLRMRQL